MPLPEFSLGLLGAELDDVGPPGGLEVLHDERAEHEVVGLERAGRSPHLPSSRSRVADVGFLGHLGGRQELGIVHDGHGVLGAADCEALELLVAEDGSRVAARRGAEPLDDQAGIEDAVLAGGADDDRADAGVLHLLDHHLVGIIRRLAPHLRGVPELHLVVDHGEPDGFLGTALDVDAVPAGPLDFARQVGAALAMVQKARVGVLVDDAGPRGDAHGPGQGPGPHEDEGVLVQRVLARLVFRHGVVGPEAAGADVLLKDLIGNRPSLVGLRAEVDLQYLSEISAFGCCHGDHLPFLVFTGTTLLPSTLG